jgi:hypothetical protein
MLQMTHTIEPAASNSDVEKIRLTLETYFKGHATGDASHMREAFMETAHIEGFRGHTFLAWTLEDYCAIFLVSLRVTKPHAVERLTVLTRLAERQWQKPRSFTVR